MYATTTSIQSVIQVADDIFCIKWGAIRSDIEASF